MTVEQRSPEQDLATRWVDAFTSHDKDEFAPITPRLVNWLAGYVRTSKGLATDQARELAHDTVVAAWVSMRRGKLPHNPVPWLRRVADNVVASFHRGRYAVKDAPDLHIDVEDIQALHEFADAEDAVDRWMAARRDMPVFLGLMYDAVESLADKERTALRLLLSLAGELDVDKRGAEMRALEEGLGLSREQASRRVYNAHESLKKVAAALWMARTDWACSGFRSHLGDWQPGPLPEKTRMSLLAHVAKCHACKPRHAEAMKLVGGLPVFVLLLAIGIDEQQELDAPVAVTGSDELLPPPSLAVRIAQVPGVRQLVDFAQRHPQLVQRSGGVAAAVATVATLVTIVGSSAPSDKIAEAAVPPPSPDVITSAPPPGDSTTTPGTPPTQAPTGPVPTPGTGTPPTGEGGTVPNPQLPPASGAAGPRTGPGPGSGTGPGGRGGNPQEAPVTWGYASPREFQYEHAVGEEIELHRQWQWGTWRTSPDPAMAGRHATMIRTGTGRYLVRLPGLAGTSGVPHAESSAGWGFPQAVSCQLAGTWTEGPDRMADVACFDPAGVPRNLPFLVTYTGSGNGPSQALTARYDPAVSGTGRPVTVRRTGIGQYTVDSAGTFTGRGYARITALGTNPARCRPVSTTGGQNLRITIECLTPAGQPADTGWTVSYVEQTALHRDSSVPAAYLTTAGDPAAPVIAADRSWSSNGETPTVARTGVGVYDLQYQRIGNPRVYPADAVVVTAVGGQQRYCRNWAWNSYSYPSKLRILVYCFDSTGRQADATFALAYLRAPTP